jgi:hypothetical protein
MIERRVSGRGKAVAGALAGVLFAATGHAQPSETSAASADRLFHEGKAALEAGRYSEACPKLAESQKLDPATGTLLALALCHQGQGETASAWRELQQVVEASQGSGGRADRAALARKRIADIEPHLSRLTVKAPHPEGPLSVRRDGEEVPQAEWGVATPVDPGDHLIEVSAPGRPPWKTSVHVGPDGDAKVVVVPELAATHATASVEPTSAGGTSEPPKQGDRTLGWIVGGAGVVALGVGAFFGVRALSDRHDATNGCPSSPCSNADAISTNDRAKTEAWVADVGLGLGVVGVAVGVYLVFVKPKDPAQVTARLAPEVGPGRGGVALSGTW